ncbi:MAG: tetratricopeptide repeat protein [Candidatus Poribacteria bacterium]|nr:tetratricopeptide repeat protein [Candidatus Poribacteria bacterium]
MMQQRRLVWLFFFIAIVAFAVTLLFFNREHLPSDNDSNIPSEVPSSDLQNQSSGSFQNDGDTRQKPSVSAPIVTGKPESAFRSASDTRDDFRSSKGDRIAKLHAQLQEQGVRVTGPLPEEIAIETEGMDTLSAARHLREFGVSEYALEYAERAVAENPESFDAVLLWAQLLHPRQHKEEKEIAFRLGLAMNPDSIEALVGLGQTLSRGSHPWEAIPYLEEAIQRDPSVGHAYYALAGSYEKSGLYDEALATYKKTYELTQDPVALRHIQAIEAGNPRIKPLPSEAQEQVSEELPPEGTLPQAPPQEETPPSGDKTERLRSETALDEEPITKPNESRNRETSAEAKQAMAEFLQMIDEYERTVDKDSGRSSTDGKSIADLRRSIDSNPNRSEDYLELARTYEEAGESEKAAEVYRRAKERFPEDERVRRESEAFRNKRGRSTKRRGENESDSSKEDSR